MGRKRTFKQGTKVPNIKQRWVYSASNNLNVFFLSSKNYIESKKRVKEDS